MKIRIGFVANSSTGDYLVDDDWCYDCDSDWEDCTCQAPAPDYPPPGQLEFNFIEHELVYNEIKRRFRK